MKRYTPNDGFDNAYLQPEDGSEQLPPLPVYLCTDVDELIAAARAVIAERDQFDGQDLLDTIDDVIERLRKALP